MKKIPTLFVRDPENPKHVTRDVNPGCEWVLSGEGVATRKYDGTCVMFDGSEWWARREVKPGKTEPDGWVEVDADETTGKRVGWEPVEQSAFAKVFATAEGLRVPGTYELCGPKVNRNPEDFDRHVLVPHGAAVITDVPLDFDGLAAWLSESDFEGIVWHHPDGRMVKLKRRDFPAGVSRD